MKVLVVISALLAVAAAGNLGFAYSSAAPYWNGAYGAYPYSAYPYSAYPYNGLYGFRAAVAAPVAAPVAPIAAPVAAPYAYNVAPYAYHGGISSQYHAQDEFGQASYGHATYNQAHSAVRDAFGGVTGSYSYVNPEGKVVQTHYTADAVHGFRVASNDLPVAPAVPAAPELVGPEPVQDTPEVAAARAEHLAAHAEAKSRTRRGAVAVVAPVSYSSSSLVRYASPVVRTLVSPVAYTTYRSPLAVRVY
ncbi:cuticle protein 7-like [Ischnura elegans]|uniref:cuticle protein 7-like n=1 Tax=Ischnura elegans TaxID=197161 RepID=UPI001ED8AF5B|nr:cuticle protein 7-like [Ischnura elegans]